MFQEDFRKSMNQDRTFVRLRERRPYQVEDQDLGAEEFEETNHRRMGVAGRFRKGTDER